MRKKDSAVGRTRDMAYIALFAVAIAIASWISIPAAVPFTMQTFAVFLTTGVLGGKRGTAAICVYLLLGAVGVPVYSGGTAGIGVIFGNTGGYLVGWIASGLIMWAVEAALGRKTWAAAPAMLLGLLACYATGTAWFMAAYARETGAIGLGTALLWCVVPFIVPDLLKMAAALAVRKRLMRIVK